MPNARRKAVETEEQARVRYNAEMRLYRNRRKEAGTLVERRYNYDEWRSGYMLRRYGVSLAEAQAMLEAQGNACAICRQPLSLDNRGLPPKQHSHIDHCHKTGVVRGILCMHCNTGLGQFSDSPDLLTAAARYLEP